MKYFLGVDVGTSSVRVGLFDQNGALIDFKSEPIKVYNFKANFYEQSSEDIWNSTIKCLKQILEENCYGEKSIKVEDIVSIGFDATCSLVVLDKNWEPVTVSPSNDKNVNIIMWMDHRASYETDFINNTKYDGLKSVGGKISIEMDPPKILWLKNHMNEISYSKIAHFFSLPDYLVWRMSSYDVRSVCTTTCKWLFNSELKKWDEKFWKIIGLEDLIGENFSKIGSVIKKPFEFDQNLKISKECAELLGFDLNLKVGISMIDAHAGGVGSLAIAIGYLEKLNDESCSNLNLSSCKVDDILVLVSGTSACFMSSSKSSKYISGVWGPYYEAMVPDMWLNEAGQSSCGKLIDVLVQTHPEYNNLVELAKQQSINIHDLLNKYLIDRAGGDFVKASQFTQNLHIYPDFHGNRSPLSDPKMTGVISGLNLDHGLENLILLYLAAIQSLAYQTRHIIEVMNDQEINFKIIILIGGLGRNTIYAQTISDVCNLPVLITDMSDSAVLFGSAILGASNYDEFKSLSFENLIRQFSKSTNDSNTKLLKPSILNKGFHQRKYEVYKLMLSDQIKYREIMNSDN